MPLRYNTDHRPSSHLNGHRHLPAYLALVESGAYLEFSVDGIYRCHSQMAVVHPPYHAHGNRFDGQRVRVTNVVLPAAERYRVLRLAPKHFFAARNCRNPEQLLSIVFSEGRRVRPEPLPPLVQTLAESLAADPTQRIKALAQSQQVSPEHAARQFKRFAGMTLTAYRAERRLRVALRDLEAGQPALTVANRWGFSDQSHLCRTIKAATRRTITALQRSDSFKTGQPISG